MLLKAFKALGSGTRDRDDPYLDRPASRRRATGPDSTQRQLQEPLTFDNLHISESDSDEYGLPQARKSSYPRHDAHKRTISREQAEIEYKCSGCGDQVKLKPSEGLPACKYCHVKPVDPRRRPHNRPQLGPLPNRQIRTPGQLEESFRSLYFRLGVILHDQELEHKPPRSPLRSPQNSEQPPSQVTSTPKSGPTSTVESGPSRLGAPWSPKKRLDTNDHVLRTPPARAPPAVPASRQGHKLTPIPSSGLRPPQATTPSDHGLLTTPRDDHRPVSRGSPSVPQTSSNTSPRKRALRPPQPSSGARPLQAYADPKLRAKYQLLEAFRSDFSSLYGSVEYLNAGFCTSIRPKITKRSMSEGSNVSLKSHEESSSRPGVPRHDSERPNPVRFDVRKSMMPTPTLQPVLPDSKALLAGHLHDVVSSLADYNETRQIERSTTVARKSTYQTSPHVSYSELHAYHTILARFTLDMNYCLSLVVKQDDDEEKRTELKDEIVQFTASVLVCCLEVIYELLTAAREEPTAPQGARYLLLILTTPWLIRPMTALSAEYARWHDGQAPNNRQDLFARYEEEARLLLLQSSPSKRSPSSLRDRILSICIGRIANLPDTVQHVFPRWFANMPVNMYVEVTRNVQTANTKAIRNVPEQKEAQTEQMKKLHDRRFLSEMIGAANIDHFEEENANLPWYSKRKSAWKLRTSSHTLQLLVVANDIRSDAVARYSAQSGQGRASDDSFQPFPIDYFYTPLLDPAAGRFDVSLDFELWDSKKTKFTMCQYPFLLTLGTKARILEYDNERRKKDAVRQEWHASKGMSADPYFHLYVRREHIIEDSFKAIRQAVGSMSNVTSKKLRVHFDGEEGVDVGGVQKEWFLLLTQKLFSEDLGLFYLSDSGHYWFHTACNRPNEYYELVGAVFGLAIYNQTPLFAPFPPFLFKKLAAAAPRQVGTNMSWRHLWRPTLQDFAQLSPNFASIMRQGLADPSIMADLTFEIPVWQNGKNEYVPLGPEGSTREITSSNIDEFVDKAVNYMLKDSIHIPFTAFSRGFHSICGGNALSLFRGEELELLVRGSEDFDLDTLRAAVVYDNWKRPRTDEDLQSEDTVTRHYPVVRFFWSFFARATLDKQRRILQFITGTDRLPPAGIVNLVIKVSRQQMERGEFRYPSARTCFNQILLPDCFGPGDSEVFDRVFDNALDMAGTGFGMK